MGDLDSCVGSLQLHDGKRKVEEKEDMQTIRSEVQELEIGDLNTRLNKYQLC